MLAKYTSFTVYSWLMAFCAVRAVSASSFCGGSRSLNCAFDRSTLVPNIDVSSKYFLPLFQHWCHLAKTSPALACLVPSAWDADHLCHSGCIRLYRPQWQSLLLLFGDILVIKVILVSVLVSFFSVLFLCYLVLVTYFVLLARNIIKYFSINHFGFYIV